MFFTDPEWKSCWEGVHVDLSSTDVGRKLSALICLASISRMSRTPAHGRVRLTSSWRRKREARLRDRLQSYGERLGAELDSEWAASPHHRAGYRCPVHRRHGRGSCHGRPRPCGRIAPACMSVALDLGGWDKRRKSKTENPNNPHAPSGCVPKPLRGSYRLMFAKVPAMPSSYRPCLSILAAALLLTPSSFAFDSPLSDQAVREAYFWPASR